MMILMMIIIVIIIAIIMMMIKIILIIAVVIIINNPFQPGGFSTGSTTGEKYFKWLPKSAQHAVWFMNWAPSYCPTFLKISFLFLDRFCSLNTCFGCS